MHGRGYNWTDEGKVMALYQKGKTPEQISGETGYVLRNVKNCIRTNLEEWQEEERAAQKWKSEWYELRLELRGRLSGAVR